MVTTSIDRRYSDPGAVPTKWTDAQTQLRDAPVSWLSTVSPDGRPHVTPLLSVWSDGSLFFCTGPEERKAQNLRHNAYCSLTTGTNALDDGLDIVVEGHAVRVTDEDRLRRLAQLWESKYGETWHFDVRGGAFQHNPGEAWVFEVAPSTAFGFAKGDEFSQTRWRFDG